MTISPISSWTRRSTACEPIRPAPPMTTIFLPFKSTVRLRASAPRTRAHRLDDTVLRRLVEVGVHGDADDLSCQPFRYRNAAGSDRIAAIAGLLRKRDRVIDSRGDAGRFARRSNGVAARRDQRVLRPDRGCAPHQPGHGNVIGETLGIT